ncbi:aspartyl aminopeptidase [Gautieria morchelliformis]|nr:aspartyl aminopeptidase [Gautieria morchelliformis]
MMMPQAGPPAAHAFLDFVNASPTPFHAVHVAARRLEKSGFHKLREHDNWDLKGGGKYYLTRNQGSLLAFTLPPKWKSGTGLSIVATHVDSPNLRVRPTSKKSNLGYIQVAVETYGGGIWHSWLDRDLSVAGRIIVTDNSGSNFTSKLVKVNKPVLRIPSLAIHLDRNVNEALKFNQQTEFVPVLGMAADELNASSGVGPAVSAVGHHHSALLSLLAEEVSVAPENIADMELSLYDTQPSTLGGVTNEFIFSPRLDNLLSSFCAVEAIAEGFHNAEGNVNCIALFNHEEVGSVSTTGADGSLIPLLLQRLSPESSAYAQSVAKSFLISADMTHAVHPSYPNKHEENHQPIINGGIAVKVNHNQRYGSDALGTFLVRKLAQKKGRKVQEFVARNDMACGSTVGPMLSKIGIRTVDVGNPMLSMHSCREMAGSHDVQSAIELFSAFFEGFAELDAQLALE